MKLYAISIALALVAACKEKQPDHAAPEQHHETATSDWPAPAANPVQTEMRMLSDTLGSSVRAIGLGDVRPIEHQLHKLHEAKEATEAAVKGGTYKLPKNPEQLEAFEGMDNAFHEQLEVLAKASQANDVAGAADALGTLVKACQGCHAMFRN